VDLIVISFDSTSVNHCVTLPNKEPMNVYLMTRLRRYQSSQTFCYSRNREIELIANLAALRCGFRFHPPRSRNLDRANASPTPVNFRTPFSTSSGSIRSWTPTSHTTPTVLPSTNATSSSLKSLLIRRVAFFTRPFEDFGYSSAHLLHNREGRSFEFDSCHVLFLISWNAH